MNIKRALGRHKYWVVWPLRLIVGGTFIFSGFAKAVDPWGFMIKINEYLTAWHIDFVPNAAILCVAAMIAMAEFTVGVLLALGCSRRMTPVLAFAALCVMTPLTLYIAIFSPVDDCGCFGEALVLSNWATFAKNVVLIVLAFLLIKINDSVGTLFAPITHWIVTLGSIGYCLILSVIGYTMQPVVDFRPYKLGTSITEDIGESELRMVYEKDGRRQSFAVDALPGADWQYVGREESGDDSHGKLLAVYDADGDDVTSVVFEDQGPQMVLVVSNPHFHGRARAGMANNINRYAQAHGGSMIALVALSPENLDEWIDLASPDYEVYSVEDTSLKELVRGDAALVYLEDGIIKWKRNLYFIPSDFPDAKSPDNKFEKVYPPDSGQLILHLTLFYISILLLPAVLSIPWLVYRRRRAKRIKQKKTNNE